VFAAARLQNRREGIVGIQVAAASTVFEFGHRVKDCGWDLGFLVRTGLVGAGVATGAIRHIGAKFPGDRFVVGRMASFTANSRVMHFVIRAGMRVPHSRPRRAGRVAGVTRPRGDHMGSRLPGGAGAVVAGGARTGRHSGMAERRRKPGAGAVTAVARGGGLHVAAGLAGCGAAVVAGDTAAGRNAGVIERGRNPGGGAVAGVARGGCLYVVRRLARGHAVVVTGHATAWDDGGVAETGAGPGDARGVALIARLGGLHMACRFGGAGRAAALGVAELALPGRALEYTACMAGLAVGLGMRPGQREAGAQMIKARATLVCGRDGEGKHQYGTQQAGAGSQLTCVEARYTVHPLSDLAHVVLPCSVERVSVVGRFGHQRDMPPTPDRIFLNELVT